MVQTLRSQYTGTLISITSDQPNSTNQNKQEGARRRGRRPKAIQLAPNHATPKQGQSHSLLSFCGYSAEQLFLQVLTTRAYAGAFFWSNSKSWFCGVGEKPHNNQRATETPYHSVGQARRSAKSNCAPKLVVQNRIVFSSR